MDRECCGVLSVSGGASANEKLLAWYESLSEVGEPEEEEVDLEWTNLMRRLDD